MRRKSIFYSFVTYMLIFVLMTGTILPNFFYEAKAAADNVDPFMEQWLPQPGSTQSSSPFLANNGMEQRLQGLMTNYPVLDNQYVSNQNPSNHTYEDPVSLPQGELVLHKQDNEIPSYGFSLHLSRTYRSGQKDKMSPFGYGWSFPYDHYIQMFADFNIAEFAAGNQMLDNTLQSA